MTLAGSRQIVSFEPTFESWREAARPFALSHTAPEHLDFADPLSSSTAQLFESPPAPLGTSNATLFVPKSFIERAKVVACHRDAQRWNLLYRILFRLQSSRNLMKIELDDEIAEFRRLEHQVRRDLHKMHAFVRFRKVVDEAGEEFVSWYEPAHRILQLAAPFFAERFAVMRWAILTPDASVRWNLESKQLEYGPGVTRASAPQGDEFEALWKTYYSSIFNPARTNIGAMRAEMPARYWKNLPEIHTLPTLLAEADTRVQTMIARQPKITADAFLPETHALPVLRDAIHQCEGCDLHKFATQPVFGQGKSAARMMLIGEQPGDEEDRSGEPFVGPAGRLLNLLLQEAGIDRTATYVTNAVKHFKFIERGKRRLHDNPRASEIFACRPWLLAEIEAVQPQIVVCLGATASKSLFGSNFGLMRERGKLMESPYARRVVATLHPSAVLRAPDPARANEMRAMLVADLKLATGTLGELSIASVQ